MKKGGHRRFNYDSWHAEQKKFEAERSGRDIVVKPRQIGFSTLELARDLWYPLAYPGSQVLVIGHDGDLAEQLFTTLRLFADALKDIDKLPRTLCSNKREIVFAKSGSAVRIVEAGETDRAASKKGRSGTVHRLHATEVAFWGAPAETMGAVMLSVPEGGEVCIESTTNGVGGLFHKDVQAARGRRTGYKLFFFPWWEHDTYRVVPDEDFDPATRDDWEEKLRALGCDDAQIAWWRAKVDDPKIGLERALADFPIDIDTCFRASGKTWLDPKVLDALAIYVREPLRFAPVEHAGRIFAPANIYAEPQRGLKYAIGADVAEGIASDASSACVIDLRTGLTAATWWSDTTSPGDFGVVLAVLGTLYNRAIIAPERNNHGHTTLDRLANAMRYSAIYEHEDERPGFRTDPVSRPLLWDDLADAIRQGVASTPDAETLNECKTLVVDADGRPRARGKKAKVKDACTDDRYVAWAIAWQVRARMGGAVKATVPDTASGSRWGNSPGRGFG